MLKTASQISWCFLFLFVGLFVLRILLFPAYSYCTHIFTSYNERQPSNRQGEQQRGFVQKDFWMLHKTQRLHHCISSPRSILTIRSIDGKWKAIEKMEEMTCLLQESQDKEGQSIRLIQAAEGFYDYAKHSYEAPKVFLAFFDFPGHTLPKIVDLDRAYLQGIAQKAILSFDGQTPDFQFEKFKADFYPAKYKDDD